MSICRMCVGIAIGLEPFHYLNDKLHKTKYIVFTRASYNEGGKLDM